MLFAEAGFEFFIFHLNHNCAGDCCERGQRPADCQSRAYAPGEHLAEMPEIDGMANMGANPRRRQVLLAMVA